MAATNTLLCIHRDPAQLHLLEEKGYGLITATNGSDGLRLLMSQSVHAVVLEYYLGLLNGAVVADEIRQVRPQLPIVMVADHLDLPDGALKSVDALVIKSDGPHFLWATVHFVLNIKPDQRLEGKLNVHTPPGPRLGETRMHGRSKRSESLMLAQADKQSPFSAELWKSIWNGTIRF